MFQYKYYGCFPEIQVRASMHMPSAEKCHPKNVGQQYRTFFRSPVWHLEFWGGCQIFRKFWTPTDKQMQNHVSECWQLQENVPSPAIPFEDYHTGDKHRFMRMTQNTATISSEWPITSAPKEGQINLFCVKGTLIVFQHLWNSMTWIHLYFDVLWHLCKDMH